MIIVLLADGFEEIEALTPVDMLCRSGLTVKTVGITGRTVTGAHGICVICDLLPEDVDLNKVDTVILPGGMPGTTNLDTATFTEDAIKAVLRNGGRIAAICAAPLILGKRGLLNGKKATCYPGFEKDLFGATVVDADVITDGNITTARGMGVATEFAEELITNALGKKKAREISRAICRKCNDENCEEEEVDVSFADYTLPTAELLDDDKPFEPDADEIKKMEAGILSFFKNNNITVTSLSAESGVRLTKFNLTTGKRTTARQVLELETELMLALGACPIRIEAPIPGGSTIGIEVPNKRSGVVTLRGLADSAEFKESTLTSVCLGREFNGKPIIADVTRMPHMLISGATGMGKSVVTDSILTSLLLKTTPDQLRLILIDPKQVEFNAYDGIPHLLCPIIHDACEAVAVLEWALKETERRYGLLSTTSSRNIDFYNDKIKDDPSLGEYLPKIIIVIDELADLMLQVKDPAEQLITRIAQKSRAAGIHLIIGTQRPSNDVITGFIKANIPTRLCCKVMTEENSRTVLDARGAEKLLNFGDALYYPVGAIKSLRMQCAYVSYNEIERITSAAKSIGEGIGYDKRISQYVKNRTLKIKYASFITDDFIAAVDVVMDVKKASTALIQRKLSIGYGKAAKYIDIMEEMGIVAPMVAHHPREVLMTREQWKILLTTLKE